ncbi:DNA cytosine methyltransferase [Gordonia aichiensis]|uniref:DNA (cytosine-5-)-methyltransferase n=1 Tax=Gordonia aichiensis NBRC 108223 TaxID=1220583 RepID=L7KNP6_9ACTN|nr:DNA cytosine methyltransferase [Gordonia aichiensis]GAC49333.1 putative cytosine-specific methyltransferase [Gordonia aichiensis NBRC 108223]
MPPAILGPPSGAAGHNIVDLFAGPGGLDVAAAWLGIETTGIEWDEGAFATRETAKIHSHKGDVRDFHAADFPNASILAAGPPCQTFTVAGKGAGRLALDTVLAFIKRMSVGDNITEDLKGLSDERTGLVLEPLRWALDATAQEHPYEAIVLEQVPAVLPVWEAMEEVLQGIGYQTVSGVLRTEEYGVPQTRRRAVLVANLTFKPQLPARTHQRFARDQDPRPGSVPTWKPMSEALSLLPGSARNYPFEVVSNYGSGGDPRARGRRHSSEPSFTVTGKVTRNRILDSNGKWRNRFSHAEAGLLQTFPHDYPWSGVGIGQQIGNAIPPRLGAHVLCAALGLEVAAHDLDKVVALPWARSRNSLRPARSLSVLSDPSCSD